MTAALDGLAFTKGHGTENDFVLLDDPDGTLDVAPPQVAWLCDRRAGVGGDGLIRVVRSGRLPEGAASLAEDPAADWFMDYRNADGSAAQMCGNGVRVFAHYLLEAGHVEASALAPDGPGLRVGTRSGVKTVHLRPDGWYSVGMGRWSVPGGQEAVARGHDAVVGIGGLAEPRPGLRLDIGNPHTVVMLGPEDDLDAVDLTRAPVVDPIPPEGTNVEVLQMLEPAETAGRPIGRVRMRVHERGVGETRSCGTGTCVAAAAAALWAGPEAPTVWEVHVPGGQVEVDLRPDETAVLTGPAVLVATGRIDRH